MTFVNVCFLIVSLSPTASTYVFLSLLPSLPHISPSSVLPPSFSILPVFFPSLSSISSFLPPSVLFPALSLFHFSLILFICRLPLALQCGLV